MILSLIKLPSGNFIAEVICLGKILKWDEITIEKLVEKVVFANPFTDKEEVMEIIEINWPEYIM